MASRSGLRQCGWLLLLSMLSSAAFAQVEQWVARYTGPVRSAQALAIAVDGKGNSYVTGWSEGVGTGDDYATVKYDSDGNEVWVARYDGPAHRDDTSLAVAVEATRGARIRIAGQNLFWEREGAFTGEVSGPMLAAAGCSHVIIGHSERRQYFGETDQTVSRRIAAATCSGRLTSASGDGAAGSSGRCESRPTSRPPSIPTCSRSNATS